VCDVIKQLQGSIRQDISYNLEKSAKMSKGKDWKREIAVLKYSAEMI
jgi:hypothetical protein